MHISVRQLYQYQWVLPEGHDIVPWEHPEPSHPQSGCDTQVEQLPQNWQFAPSSHDEEAVLVGAGVLVGVAATVGAGVGVLVGVAMLTFTHAPLISWQS